LKRLFHCYVNDVYIYAIVNNLDGIYL